jgi:membrane-bound lytic murein transglycosylase D
MIRRTLKQEGVPQDLIYLAQAESGFHPLAVSRAGARGIWQFMASRASGYGLERNWWIDERQDPEKATRAAAHHLKDLYDQFGDWYLAMAAYNSGPGTVQSAVKRTGYADFWELYRRNVLPKETRNYVPIILAVTIMAKNPEQYGLGTVAKEKPVPYETVKIDYPIDLRLVAECVDASASELQELNPSLLRLTTPKDQAFELHLPAGSAGKFETVVASIPVDKRVWWRYHKVQAGETLASIARTYRTTPTSIREANSLEEDGLAPESRLIIPIAPGKESDSTRYARTITRYKVRKGDTVESVAENFGVSAKMIRSWNRLKGNSLATRKTLLIHLPVSGGARETQVVAKRPRRAAGERASSNAGASAHKTASRHVLAQSASSKGRSSQRADGNKQAAGGENSSAGLVHHKVKQGETLYSIANSYNTTVAALKHDNRNIATLRPGMVLVIRGDR